jgi:hypothetical protein
MSSRTAAPLVRQRDAEYHNPFFFILLPDDSSAFAATLPDIRDLKHCCFAAQGALSDHACCPQQ